MRTSLQINAPIKKQKQQLALTHNPLHISKFHCISFNKNEADLNSPDNADNASNATIILSSPPLKGKTDLPSSTPFEVTLEDDIESQSKLKFIFRVLSIMTVQFGFTLAVCSLSYYFQEFLSFQLNNYYVAIILAAVLMLIALVVLCWSRPKKFPLNLILLVTFSLCLTYNISMINSYYVSVNHGNLIVVAIAIAFLTLLALCLYALFSPLKFSKLIAIIIVIGLNVLAFAIQSIWLNWNSIVQNLYCFLGVTFCGVLIVFDVQWILNSERNMNLNSNDFVIGAIMPYVDIFRFFLWIFSLLGIATK